MGIWTRRPLAIVRTERYRCATDHTGDPFHWRNRHSSQPWLFRRRAYVSAEELWCTSYRHDTSSPIESCHCSQKMRNSSRSHPSPGWDPGRRARRCKPTVSSLDSNSEVFSLHAPPSSNHQFRSRPGVSRLFIRYHRSPEGSHAFTQQLGRATPNDTWISGPLVFSGNRQAPWCVAVFPHLWAHSSRTAITPPWHRTSRHARVRLAIVLRVYPEAPRDLHLYRPANNGPACPRQTRRGVRSDKFEDGYLRSCTVIKGTCRYRP